MLVMWDVRDVGCSGCGMFRMWDVRDVRDVGDVGCAGCGMFGMWDVGDVGCWGCGMLGMWDVWDVGCGMFAGMWDVDLQNALWPVFLNSHPFSLITGSDVIMQIQNC